MLNSQRSELLAAVDSSAIKKLLDFICFEILLGKILLKPLSATRHNNSWRVVNSTRRLQDKSITLQVSICSGESTSVRDTHRQILYEACNLTLERKLRLRLTNAHLI